MSPSPSLYTELATGLCFRSERLKGYRSAVLLHTLEAMQWWSPDRLRAVPSLGARRDRVSTAFHHALAQASAYRRPAPPASGHGALMMRRPGTCSSEVLPCH